MVREIRTHISQKQHHMKFKAIYKTKMPNSWKMQANARVKNGQELPYPQTCHFVQPQSVTPLTAMKNMTKQMKNNL